MDPTGGPAFRNHRSPSSDRFRGLFSFSPRPSASATFTGGDELSEDDVFWNGDDFAGTTHHHLPRSSPFLSSSASAAAITTANHRIHRRCLSFQHLENSGILAALPEPDPRSQTLLDGPVPYRKPSFSASSSSSKTIPSVPRPPQISQNRDYSQCQSQSAPSRKFQKSAPMKVPVLSKATEKHRNGDIAVADLADEIEDYEMLPPHEIVARGSGILLPNTTFSVLEGVGRTLKGRDLRQVRNAIWRKTGFLD